MMIIKQKDGPRKAPLKHFGMELTWKTKKGTTFVGAGGYNRNERDRGIDDKEWVDRERWRKKINLL